MSNNLRIRTSPNAFEPNFLKVKLEQDFDFIEILSLNITQEEVYKRFCSDYGVVVGRVIMNNGVGIPNAKVSIFVPITEDDSTDEEIRDLYPYGSILDKDSDGKRYNLLPDTQQSECHTPVGTFPNKLEILDNDKLLSIHEKYYKFTAVTNAAGDYMIFGVPTGTHFINIDCDLSDIGLYSQKPYDFMREGQPKSSFDTSNKFKGGDDLDKLPQIKHQQTSVNVNPFWGDLNECEIGITRIDFDLRYDLKPSAIFMGSIFGDNEKNSINKRCRPRKNLGKLCETVSNTGSIEMIRKDLDGNNERFDVEGGRVINDDGVWAYQVPMNLDYMITNEFGDLVPSDDPSKGIPTRAEVRFRIGLDVTGGEGILRTRAKYLVPHNPNSYAESDYSFDDTTGSGLNGGKHFKNLYWNKIYSVKNFIPRFQTTGGGPFQVDIRNMIGVKDVDDCTGTKNPFPFNRLDSDINPLFSILCTLVTIIASIVALINATVITLINAVIYILNGILAVICEVIFFIGKIACALQHPLNAENRANCRAKACIGSCGGDCDNCICGDLIPYIPCITLKCQDEEYGPGCIEGGKPLPWAATNRPPLAHWPNDGHGHGPDAGYVLCTSLALAEALNVWEFDFYNDWVNGSLYSFLLKYKHKKRGKQKFCEYDCDEFGVGIDGNDDGTSDNKCKRNWLVDSCTANGVKTSDSDMIKDGLIKAYEDQLYYAVYTHLGDYKLFATDVIELGAVFECDWQGIPKIQPYLIPTSYKTPELVNEYDDVTGDLVTSGYDSSEFFGSSLYFNITCFGLTTNSNNCINIRRQCEIGVGLDEDRTDESAPIGCGIGGFGNSPSGGGSGSPDNEIGNCDIDDLFFRDAFTLLNLPTSGIDLTDTSNPNKHALFETAPYVSFRNYSNGTVRQPRGNSYYFYFGLTPGKTALDLMNYKYFESCSFVKKNDFIIIGASTPVSVFNGTDGAIDVTIIGGVGPYTYLWSNGATTQDLTGVPSGTYTVTVTDSEGAQATSSFNVGQPFPVSCFATPTPVSINSASDGSIQIVSIGGGDGGPYTTSITGPVSLVHTGVVSPTDSFTGLPSGTYTVTTTDNSSNTVNCTTSGVTITTPPPLTMTVNSTDILCYGTNSGTISFNYVTGVAPVTYNVTGPNYYSVDNNNNLTNLPAGVYTITLTDSIGQTISQTVTLTEPPLITGTLNVNNITCNGLADGQLTLTSVGGGTPPYTYSWAGPTPDNITDTTNTLGPIGTVQYPSGTYTLTITDTNGCTKDISMEVKEPPVITLTQVSITNVTCNGGSNGSVTVAGGGGNPAISNGTYQYRINSGTWQASPTFNGLTFGTYTIDVKDINNCSTSLIINITQPSIVVLSVVSQTTNSITVSGSGGNGGPYEFRYRLAPAGPWSAWAPTNPITGLTASTSYNLQARDSQQCESAIVTHSTN